MASRDDGTRADSSSPSIAHTSPPCGRGRHAPVDLTTSDSEIESRKLELAAVPFSPRASIAMRQRSLPASQKDSSSLRLAPMYRPRRGRSAADQTGPDESVGTALKFTDAACLRRRSETHARPAARSCTQRPDT